MARAAATLGAALFGVACLPFLAIGLVLGAVAMALFDHVERG